MTAQAHPVKAFHADWKGHYLDFVLGLIVFLSFSQVWMSPVFGYADQMPDGGLIRMVWYPVYAAAVALMWRGRHEALSLVIGAPFLIGLVGLAFVSALWSIDPDVTSRRALAVAMTSLAGLSLAARFSWARLSEMISVGYVVLILVSLIVVAGFGHVGIMQVEFPGAWRGAWVEKNLFGGIMGIGMVTLVAAALHNPSRRWIWLFVACLAILMVLKSTSKTSLLAMMLGFAAMGMTALSRRGPIMAALLIWAAVVTATVMAILLTLDPGLLFTMLGKDTTLTGRTLIWDAIARQVALRPWTGYGYGVVWTTPGGWTPLGRIIVYAHFRPFHAHSGWYEVWLGLGLVGLWAWSLTFAQTWIYGLWRAFSGGGGFFSLAFLSIYSLISISESIVLGYNDYRWMLLCMVAFKLGRPDPVGI